MFSLRAEKLLSVIESVGPVQWDYFWIIDLNPGDKYFILSLSLLLSLLPLFYFSFANSFWQRTFPRKGLYSAQPILVLLLAKASSF